MKNSARQAWMAAFDVLRPAGDARRLARLPIFLVVPGTPAEELAAEIRHQDRELVIERRDLVFEVDRIALVGPEEHLEHILVPQIHEVFGHGRGELPVGSLHQEVQTGVRVEHLESRVVGMRFRLPATERHPLGLPPGGVFAGPRDLEVVDRLDRQLRPFVGLRVHRVMITARRRRQEHTRYPYANRRPPEHLHGPLRLF